MPFACLAWRALMPPALQKIAGGRAQRHHRKAEPPPMRRTLAGVPDVMCSVEPENRSSSGMTASQEAQLLGAPSFSKSPPRPPRLRVKMIPLRNFGVRIECSSTPRRGGMFLWGARSGGVAPLAPRLRALFPAGTMISGLVRALRNRVPGCRLTDLGSEGGTGFQPVRGDAHSQDGCATLRAARRQSGQGSRRSHVSRSACSRLHGAAFSRR